TYLTNWDPSLNGLVHSLVLSPSNATIYVGGNFSAAGGSNRAYIAALNSSDGTATAWNPGANFIVRSLALSTDSSTLYAGGDFTTIGGASRNHIASLQTIVDTMNATAWDPNANGVSVNAVVLSGNLIFVGGDFTTL